MRVGMYYGNNDVRVQEMPIPKIGAGEMLIKVMASGICGTDVVEWYRRNRIPLVLGHEIAGEVAELGKGVNGFKVGDRVSASHHVPCNTCHYCLMGHHTVCDTLRKTSFDPGGFAEFLRVPAINVEKSGVYKLPKEVSYEEGTFVEPLACVLRSQNQAGYKKGQTILIIGSGISGLLHIQLAKMKFFGKIIATDINEYRLKMASRFGADLVIHAKDETPKADLVVLCTGAKQAVEKALRSVERGGTILFFASTEEGLTFPLSINEFFWKNEITLTSSYAANPEEHMEALGIIKSKKVNVRDMITHKLGLDEIQKGFKLVAEAKESIKVIIEPQKQGV